MSVDFFVGFASGLTAVLGGVLGGRLYEWGKKRREIQT